MAQSVDEARRATHLIKKRKKEQEDMELRKKKIQEELELGNIHNKFASHYDAVEQKIKQDTIGLVTLDEMKAKQEDVIKEREKQLAHRQQQIQLDIEREQLEKNNRKRKAQKSALSFNIDEEEDDSEEDCSKTTSMSAVEQLRKKRLGMNPDVDTSFLPDIDREEAENKLREMLQQEWSEKQCKLKNEPIEITYSYWDGSGHRKSVQMKKGNSVQQLLQRCLESLRKDFSELKAASVDQLMYVKEDLIIPHHYTFYDFIVTKARGKSGPLFSFDAREDIRLINDATIEKDESHAGKVLLRTWYERHKHIFPASRWEPFNPEKIWDKYTVSDKESAKITVK